MLPYIHNEHERECIEYAHTKIPIWTNLYRKPIEELAETYRLNEEIIILQPPYIDKSRMPKFNDWAIKIKGTKFRYEIKTLKPSRSSLSDSTLKHVLHSKYMLEDILVLILIGSVYDNVIKYELSDEIFKKSLSTIKIIRTIDEYKKHIDFITK